MTLADTFAPGAGATDLLLAALARRLAARGLRLAGTVQVNVDRGPDLPCHMDLTVLPEGRMFRISQALGRDSQGCRLDPGALESAAGLALAQLDAKTDAVLVNKFGKQEAEGRGLRDLIARALELDVPVIVGVADGARTAWQEFTGGLSQTLPPDVDALADWVLAQRATAAAAQ